jgi:hypothetical protein
MHAPEIETPGPDFEHPNDADATQTHPCVGQFSGEH